MLKLLLGIQLVVMVLNVVVLNVCSGHSVVIDYFIFGDSLVESGNNNNMSSQLKANYLPYGIDFRRGPTGRFTNGKTTVDVIALLLGKKFITPYSTIASRNFLQDGINYASAAAGIREETGRHLGERISFSGQVNNYKKAHDDLVISIGNETAADYLKECIYSVSVGSNDYLNNYFKPQFYSTSKQFTPAQFADILLQQYSKQIGTLHDYGARKFILFGIGPIGCSPSALAQYSTDGKTCVTQINLACQIFNDKLKAQVDTFNNQYPDSRFIYIDVYGIFQDLINSPSSYGFNVTTASCCDVVKNKSQITCLPLQTPCINRNQYLFWDAFHQTEAANIIIGRRSYRAQKVSDAYPFDISRLAQINL